MTATGIGVTAWAGIGVIGEGDARGPALAVAAGLLVSAGRKATVTLRTP